MSEQIRVLPDPTGLAHPYAFVDDPKYGPGAHALTFDLEMDRTGRYLVQSVLGPTVAVGLPDPGYTTPTPELHLYVRDGEQWTHTFAAGGHQYGGLISAVRWSHDSRWVIVNRTGWYGLDLFNQPYTYADLVAADNIAYYQHSRRLQIYRRDGDQLVFHGYGPDEALVDPVYSATYGYGIDFDPSGQYLAICGFTGFTGLLRFDTTAGTLTIASGRTAANLLFGLPPGVDYTAFIADVTANSYLWQSWNPADPALLMRVDTTGAVKVFRRDGDRLILVQDFATPSTSLLPAWHPSGRVISIVQQGQCGYLVPVIYAWPGGQILGQVPSGLLIGTYYGDAALVFDRSGNYATLGATAALNAAGTAYEIHGAQILTFDPGGHPVAGTGSDPGPGLFDPPTYSGFTRLDEPPVGARAGGKVTWGCDAGGGGRYFAIASDDVTLLQSVGEFYSPDDWASPWGVRFYRLPGDGTACPGDDTGPTPASVLHQRQPDGADLTIGVDGYPVGMVLPDGSIRIWPDAAEPLRQKQADGTWRTVIGTDTEVNGAP